MRNTEIKNEIDEIKKWKEKIKRKYLKYEAKYYIYDFQEYKTIRYFSGNCYTSKINVDKAGIDQSDSWKNLVEFNNRSEPKTTKDKDKSPYESTYAFYEV